MFSARRESPRTLTLQRRVSMTTYIKPTVLYIKQHSITGLKYFGKTTRDPLKYNGSGKHWNPHIKKHGKKYVINLWVSEPFTDSIAISEFALAFSRDNNIVESKDWANQKPENGLDGGGNKGVPHTEETKQKISDAAKGRPHSAETRKKMSDSHIGLRSSVESIKKSSDKRRGQSRKACSVETKQKMSESRKGRIDSPETIKKRSESNRGKIRSAETRKKMSDSAKCKIFSAEHKQNLSVAKTGIPQIKVECPHCGIVGGVSNMKRWHFEHCKKKLILGHVSHQIT